MKLISILLFLFSFTTVDFAGQVDSLKAIKVAANFFANKKSVSSTQKFRQVRLYSTEKSGTMNSGDIQQPALYILNNSANGFVVISGNDKTKPILAYSLSGQIDPANIPPAFSEWLKWKEAEINYISNSSLNDSLSVNEEWTTYENVANIVTVDNSGKDPLIKTLWGQGVYYNDMCPSDAGSGYSNGRVPVGCVATAMAQLMKYWEYPVTGSGSHTYNHSVYGTQTVDFGLTTYHWELMPKAATGVNSDIATISYHCGVSVDMNYGPYGSSASLSMASQSLVTYFNYKNTLSFIKKSDFNSSTWSSLLKTEIDNFRPLLLRGSASNGNGGHVYICDGYISENYFHINWGWNSSYNGYFLFDDLTPGTNDFTYNQFATIGIQPSGNSCAVFPSALSLASDSGSNGKFRIVTESHWTATLEQSWIDISSSSGNGWSELTITANSKNLTGNTRTATIIVNVSGVLSKTIVITQLPESASLPNITPYKPSAWSDKIILSNIPKTSTDNTLTMSDSVYLDFAYINSGSSNAQGVFINALVLDSVTLVESANNGLTAGYYSFQKDFQLGMLSEGYHKIKLIVDCNSEIVEANENDNVFEKVFTVAKGAPFLYTSSSSLSFDYKNSCQEITISSNTDWNISSDQTWIVPGISSGTYKNTVTFTVLENTGLEARFGVITITGIGVSPVSITVSQIAGLPNLTPYRPSTWEDKIIVTNQLNTLIDDSIFNNQTVYVDYSYINAGNKKTEGTFNTKLYLNNVLKRSLSRTDTLGAGWYMRLTDFSLGKLSVGDYTLKLVIDEAGTLTESNENDNSYSKQFTVLDANTALTISKDTINFRCLNSSAKINISSLYNWTIDNTNKWISFSSKSGTTGDGTISVIVEANSDVLGRTGKFIVSNQVVNKEITVIQDGVTSVVDIDVNSLKIFPNPVNDKLNISSTFYKIDNIRIYNTNGILVYYKENCGEDVICNLSSLANGYYTLKVEINKIIFNRSFIKQ